MSSCQNVNNNSDLVFNFLYQSPSATSLSNSTQNSLIIVPWINSEGYEMFSFINDCNVEK